jgi:phospholipase/carboxylesterase
MVPFRDPPPAELNGTPVLLLSGLSDPIVPRHNSQALAALLRDRGATVTERLWPGGHGLTSDDVTALRQWLAL